MKKTNGVPNHPDILPSLPNVLGTSEDGKRTPLAQAASNLLQRNNSDDTYQLYPDIPKTSVDKIVEEDMSVQFLSDVVDEYRQARAKPNPRKAGRKPLFKPQLIYKILAWGERKGLSDEVISMTLYKQPSLCALLGVTRIPSSQTLWRYRQIFTETKLDFFFFWRCGVVKLFSVKTHIRFLTQQCSIVN